MWNLEPIETSSSPAQRIAYLWKFRISEVNAWVLAGAPAEEESRTAGESGRNE